MRFKKLKCNVILLVLAISIMFPTYVYAAIGDNIGGGGGTGGSGVTDGRYTYPMSEPQGYRVTLIKSNGASVKESIDITNNAEFASKVKQHFNYKNKLNYIKGSPMRESSHKYAYIEAIISPLPRVVGDGSNGYERVKEWFTRPENLRWLCESDKLNFDYNLLIDSPKYKLLIEPLVYINIANELYAMTATEGIKACQSDNMVSYNLAAVLRRQAPISLFLAKDDNAVGISAYTGQTNLGNNQYVNNATAIAQLGVGIIYFSDDKEPVDPPTPPTPSNGYDYDFMCNNLSVQNGAIREENDFNVTATFEYQQKIDCKYCTTTCDQCHLTGTYEVLIREGYYSSYWDGYQDVSYWIPPTYETRLCHKCYVNCSHCDKGELWYNKSLKGEYATPTKSALVEIFVEDAILDYTKGVEGVVKYSKTVTYSADEPITINTTLNAGENIGNKVVVARINWDGRSSEVNPNNNKIETSINVIPATNLQLEYINPNAPFRTGTDVISSFMLINQDDIGALNIRPKHNVIATFKATNPRTNEIIDTSQMSQLVVPKGGTNLIYFKWQLPGTYKEESIKVECHINPTKSVNETNYNDNICIGTNRVQMFKEHIPPDTVFENKPKYFIKPTGLEQTPTMQFADTVMTSINYERWEWSTDYIKRQYNMSLSAEYILQPDSKSPSHTKRLDTWSMRSGYGVDINIKANINSNLSNGAFTDVQNGNAYLPEYRFKASENRYRTLEVTSTNILNFPKNENTITNKGIKDYKRIHFIPLWYPDGEYIIKTYIYDCWSPVGMLSITGDINQIQIKGNSYDDWYLSHVKKSK